MVLALFRGIWDRRLAGKRGPANALPPLSACYLPFLLPLSCTRCCSFRPVPPPVPLPMPKLSPPNRNKAGSLVVLYEDDERVACHAATQLGHRGFDNVFVLSGGLMAFAEKHPAFVEGAPPQRAKNSKTPSRARGSTSTRHTPPSHGSTSRSGGAASSGGGGGAAIGGHGAGSVVSRLALEGTGSEVGLPRAPDDRRKLTTGAACSPSAEAASTAGSETIGAGARAGSGRRSPGSTAASEYRRLPNGLLRGSPAGGGGSTNAGGGSNAGGGGGPGSAVHAATTGAPGRPARRLSGPASTCGCSPPARIIGGGGGSGDRSDYGGDETASRRSAGSSLRHHCGGDAGGTAGGTAGGGGGGGGGSGSSIRGFGGSGGGTAAMPSSLGRRRPNDTETVRTDATVAESVMSRAMARRGRF
ncbi:unnamed protein product [Phaeothamnion confervicola]